MIKKIKYSLDENGYVNICGYLDSLPFEIDKNTPFKTISDSMNWKKVNGKWVKYDSTWEYENFPVRVTISDKDILENNNYVGLHGHVKTLVKQGNAKYDNIDHKKIMYFLKILSEHKKMLENDKNVLIEYK